MAELINTSGVFWNGTSMGSVHYSSEKVWPAGLEDGVVWECHTPVLKNRTSMTIVNYVTEAGLTDKVTAEGDAVVGVGDNIPFITIYRALTFRVNYGTTNYTTPSKAYLVSNSEIPSSSDVIITAHLPGESNYVKKTYKKKNRNFTLGTSSHYVKINNDNNKSKLVTPYDTTFFTFPIELNHAGRIGDLRLRITGGVCKAYLDDKVLASATCATSSNLGNVRCGADNIYYHQSFFGVNSRGGPAVSNFCYYTGEEAKNRAEIWGLQ